jgi:hypothetical protein
MKFLFILSCKSKHNSAQRETWWAQNCSCAALSQNCCTKRVTLSCCLALWEWDSCLQSKKCQCQARGSIQQSKTATAKLEIATEKHETTIRNNQWHCLVPTPIPLIDGSPIPMVQQRIPTSRSVINFQIITLTHAIGDVWGSVKCPTPAACIGDLVWVPCATGWRLTEPLIPYPKGEHLIKPPMLHSMEGGQLTESPILCTTRRIRIWPSLRHQVLQGGH